MNTDVKIERSRPGEIIAGVALLVTIGVWWTADRERTGAMQKAQEFNSTLLSQRNRENDQLERRVEIMEIALRNCKP